jgi:multidrug resistance protein, MATE family
MGATTHPSPASAASGLPIAVPLSTSSASTISLFDLEKQDLVSHSPGASSSCISKGGHAKRLHDDDDDDDGTVVDLSRLKYLKLVRGTFPSSGPPIVSSELEKLWTLSLPIVITYVLEILPEVVSIMLVGRMDSPLTKEYVDGATLSSMFISISGEAPGLGLATALDTLCSQAFGAGKPQRIGVSFQTGLFVLALAYAPIFWMNYHTTHFMTLLHQPDDVAILAGQFSRLLLPGLPFLFLYELLKKVLQAQNIVTPMVWIAVFSNLVNIVLGVYFTWYTSLGFEGAAIARSISNMVLPLATVPYFLWKPENWHAWWPGWQPRAVLAHVREFLSLGIPGMFMVVLEWFSYDIMAVLVAFLPSSVVAISVHSVLSNVANIAFRLYMGVAVATNVLVGNYVGSGKQAHAKTVAYLGMLTALGIALVLVVVITMTHNLLPTLFINDDESVELASLALLSLVPFELLDAVNCVMQGVFSGTGRQTFAAAANLLCYFVIGLPCGFVLAYHLHWGVQGFWIGLTVGYLCSACVSAYKIWHTDWDGLAHRARRLSDL